MRITDISPDQRPRERLFSGRGDELGDADLLALIWGSGIKGRNIIEMAQEILTLTGGLSGLMSLGLSELSKLPGLGPAKAGQLWAVQEVARRSKRGGPKVKMTSPREAGEYLMALCAGWTEERFGLLALNSKSELVAERILSKGTAIGTMVTPREFFREAMRYGAFSAIAFHNHPSGDCEPSAEDLAITEKMQAAGESIDIRLVDHIIVGTDTYRSLRDSGAWSR
jgi:DNA repair protein RadC